MPASRTTKHKEKNQHRFLSFSERLSKVSINAIHHIERREEQDDGDVSKFQRSLKKWRLQDRSLHFQEFYEEVSRKSQNFKLIVHYKDDIIGSLQKHLAVSESLALQALCELLVSLCMDLRSEIYPSFPSFFTVLTKLMNTRDLERLEWIFNCISLLYKYLWRYMANDIETILTLYQDLLCGNHPTHVATFAAESITFLVRKVSNQNDFFKHLFRTFKSSDKPQEGLGQIIFFVMKGVNGTLYSRSDVILPQVLSCLDESDVPSDFSFECINLALELLTSFIKREHAGTIWNVILSKLQTPSGKELGSMLKLLKTWCSYDGGILILEPQDLANTLQVLSDCPEIEKYGDVLLDLCVTLILAKASNFGVDLKEDIINSVLKRFSLENVFDFWRSILAFVNHNTNAHRRMLKFCQAQIPCRTKETVHLLVDYILINCNLAKVADDMLKGPTFHLDYSLVSRDPSVMKIQESLVQILEDESAEVELVWMVLIVFQYVRPMPSPIKTLTKLFNRLCTSVKLGDCRSQEYLAVIRTLVQTSCILEVQKRQKKLHGLCDSVFKFLLTLGEDVLKDQNALFLLDLICTVNHNTTAYIQGHADITSQLCSNLSCPESIVRMYSLRILSALHPDEDVFKACLLIEETPATIQQYRMKVLHLKKLKYSSKMSSQISSAVLRFLISNFFINFSSYWHHVQQAIITFIPEDGKNHLWTQLFKLLAIASSTTERMLAVSKERGAAPPACKIRELFITNGVTINFLTQANMKPDHYNQRILLWKTLAEIPHVEILERNNRHIVTCFFNFLENEYYKVDKSYSPHQNLLPKANRKTEGGEGKSFTKKNAVKALSVHLQVLGRFKNVLACFSSMRLKSIFEELLMHGDSDIQRRALKCFLGFKDKNVAGFSDHLFALLDDDKMKETMVQFNLSEIDPDKRESLIPVLFRLMYGRIISKSGDAGQGRKRRSIIIRFLCGLSQQEAQAFIFLAISPVKNYINEESLHQPLDGKFSAGTDITKIVPLSKQRGILNTLTEVIIKHPNLVSDHMFDYLLKLLLSLHLSYCRIIQTFGTEDHATRQRVLSFLRSLCKQTHVMINSLVELWPESSVLKSEQIESIFFVLVNPHLHKLQHECISQPNSLLHLFNEFSKQPKFAPLLGQRVISCDVETSPIQAIMKTLLSEKTSSPVTKFIMEMLIRLLGSDGERDLEQDSDEDLVKKTLANMTSAIVSVQTVPSEVGPKLLVNFVSDILTYFILKLKEKKDSAMLVQSHLRLLTVLGDHITDINLSFELGELLLSHISAAARIGRNTSSEEKSILPALSSLHVIPLSFKFLPSIGKLFSRVRSRECRIALVQVFGKACANAPKEMGDILNKASSIVSKLNAWEKRFIEEIDYDSRLTGFQEVHDWLENDDTRSILDNGYVALLPIIHNCIFTLENHSNDLSLREMSSRALELASVLAFDSTLDPCHADINSVVISSVVLPAVRRGLNSEDENQRHEWLRILVKIAELSPSESAFSRLKILHNESDPDADFFSNVQHIQLHRRTRAFRKLAQVISMCEDASVTPKMAISHVMVASYLLPLATQTLKCKDLSKHLHLRDACLEVVSCCAKTMPWPVYSRLLRQNIANMMKTPHGVKMLCAILESFHFDVASITEDTAADLENAYVTAKSKRKEKHLDGEVVDGGEVEEGNAHENETNLIYTAVVCDILPRLSESLSGKLDSESNHKLANSSNFSDIDKCNIRAPLAVAIISLIRKLPTRIMNIHLPTLILKIVAFLRHRYVEVRLVASKIISQIAELLDPSFLFIIIKELKGGLTKGYQKHVLIHTISCIFSQVESKLKVGDLEQCLSLLLGILNDDLFGKGEEERGVDKIQSKIPEARGRSKAYIVYKILAKFLKKESLSAIIAPLKDILDSTHDHKRRKTVGSILEVIGQGLQDNVGLNAEDIMVFLHGLLTENLPGIFTPNDSSEIQTRNGKQLRPQSCYLLSTEPERYGVKGTKKTQKTNLHLLVEFSLHFMNSSLKRQIISVSKKEHLEMLDPFVGILSRCLDSAHSETITEAVRFLAKLLRTSLPSLSEDATDIIKNLFKILRENSRGATNNELAAATFKTLSILCNSELGTKLSDTQLQVLLGYAEEMLYERDRQSHAFNLIQSILSRGLKSKEVLDVMGKIRDICIRTHDNAGMVHARQVYVFFLNHYPMTEIKLIKHLEFILAQLSFEYESGRLSALELLASIISSLPDEIVKSKSGTIFVPLSVTLLNDESAKCKKFTAHVIKLLLIKLDIDERDKLFSLVLQWYEDEGLPLHQQLAAMLVTIFAEAEQENFSRHLSELFPMLSKVLTTAVDRSESEKRDEELLFEADHFVFHQLSALQIILRVCKLARDQVWTVQVSFLLGCVQSFLLHPHTWVRIAASQIFGSVFASWEPQEIVKFCRTNKTTFFSNLKSKMNVLATKFCRQIQSPVLDPKLAEQCIKNLVFVVRVHHAMLNEGSEKQLTRDDNEVDSVSNRVPVTKNPIFSVLWRLSKTAKLEAANNIKSTAKRTAILKFYAAVCVSLPNFQDYLPVVIELIYRETERKIVEDDRDARSLKTLAGEVLEVVRSKAGSVAFTKVYADVRKRVDARRRDRKRKSDVELVSDPQRAAAAKVRRQQKKKDQRKRKIATFRSQGAKFMKRNNKTANAEM